MNALSGFERLLLFLGLLLISVYGAACIYRSLYSHLAVHGILGFAWLLDPSNPTSASGGIPVWFPLVVGETD
jgi:hypothetical protein